MINNTTIPGDHQMSQHTTASDDTEETSLVTPYTTYELARTLNVTHFYLSSDLAEPSKYVGMIHRLHTASPGDEFYFHLNLNGGRLDSGVQLINAIRACEGQVIMSAESQCHSMGAFLFLVGDKFLVHDNCQMMFHHYKSGGVPGKGHEQLNHIEAEIKWYTDIMKQVCYPFLSHEEINRILKGEDLWLDSQQIRDRLESAVQIVRQQRADDEKILKTEIFE